MLSSVANFLSSLTAAIAVSSGTAVLSEMSGLSEKGIPCSLTAVLRKYVNGGCHIQSQFVKNLLGLFF